MVYMGSKNRLAKDLLPIITAELKPNQWYVEPFVGGCNMIDKVNHSLKLGSDSNEYLIALLKYVQEGNELPEYVEKEEYQRVKDDKGNYPDWYVGYLGFVCSFRGIFFSSYVRNDVVKTNPSELGKIRHYQTEQRNNLLRQDLSGIKLECCSYDELLIPDNSVIYCDPPYQDTSKYRDTFDSNRFWEWVRVKSKEGHKIYVSEYNAPDDFKCIWSKEKATNLSGKGNKTTIEKLFVYGED